MASITIRNLDDEIKQRLRVRAAEHGRSMEEDGSRPEIGHLGRLGHLVTRSTSPRFPGETQ